ncbi:acyltransferase [uncultured Aquimarina sp.]|uniref:acyltransferase n=1 Tax=uncultured Aquimarina sp. TaxID=575652 RepID=UPI002603EAB3|nr:acyltransferase [uncultured Aquimarina sp.]
MIQIINKIRFDIKADRLGPDCPFTHWKLYFKSKMIKLCKNKFDYFGNGAEFRAGAYAITCSKISIGDKVVIRPGTMLFADPRKSDQGKITIENGVLIGSDVHIYVANHRYGKENTPVIEQGHFEAQSVTLKRGCWVGAKSIILPGVTIGENSIIGAGSIVTKNIPSNVIAIGSPAKVIKNTYSGE